MVGGRGRGGRGVKWEEKLAEKTSWQEKKQLEGNFHTRINHVKDVANGHVHTEQQQSTSTEGAISC